MGDNINSYRALVGNSEEIKRLEYLVKDGKTIIKFIIKKFL
jgi:hypothetical protein